MLIGEFALRMRIMEDWATHKKLNEAQNLGEIRGGVKSQREELERQIAEEREAQKYRTFKQWSRKQELLL